MIGLTHLSPVYAGGALIATQVHGSTDIVLFHTADPVTGTTMVMGDGGTYTYKEESEPLGQRIEPVDPSPGYPDEYTEITDIASQPNWNCVLMKEVSGGFFNMPVECQKKDAQMMDFSIEGMLYDIDQANLERATEAKFGKDIGKIRKIDEIKRELGYILRATAKRSGGGEQGSVIEANIPDPCAWDNGNPDCEVNVPSGDIPGFVDASNGGDSQSLQHNALIRGDAPDEWCDITYPVFPFRNKEWTGIVRKTNTEYKHQFGTARTAHFIRELGEQWSGSSQTPIRVGDLSLRGGKDTPDHKEHQKGYQVDIGLFVKGGKNIGGVNYHSTNFDFQTTQKLITILQNDPTVTRIIFNDPRITGPKIARDSKGVHDNHLHVEYDDGCR